MQDFTGFQSSNSRTNLASFSGIEVLHPYAALAVATGTFPPDLALDASDCWDLFSIMDSVARASKRDDVIGEVKKLRPEMFFRKAECIKSIDTIPFAVCTTLAPSAERSRAGRLAKSTARARDDDDFSFDVIAHSVCPLIFGSPVVAFRL